MRSAPRSGRLLVLAGSACLIAAALVLACTSAALVDETPKSKASGDSSPSSPVSDDGGPSASLQEYAQVYAEAACGYFEKCNPFVLVVAGEGANCRQTLSAWAAEVATARGTTPNIAELNACVSKLGATSCFDYFDKIPECKFHGKLADAELCAFGDQCASGYCAYAAGGQCGRCVEPIPTGGACSFSSECIVGSQCVANKCAAFGRVGDACKVSTDCGEALRCSSNKCAAELGQNSVCTSNDDCDRTTGLYCSVYHGVGTCQHWLTAHLGETCGADAGAATLTYCVQSYCGSEGKCLAKGGLGEPLPDGGQCTWPLIVQAGVCVDPAPASCR